MARARQVLKEAAPGLSAAALYKAIMVISGHLDEVEEETGAGTRKARYYPEGYLKVENTVLPVIGGDGPDGTEPVKQALVKSRNFFKLAHTYTDANGYFKISKGYKRKAKIVVKFKNDRCAIKGITGDLKFWQFAFPVKKKIGKFSRTDMQNIRHTFRYNSNSKLNEARIWAAANAINARWEMNVANSRNGLPELPYLKIWLRGDAESRKGNNTPMSNHVYNAFGGSTECIISRGLNDIVVIPIQIFIGNGYSIMNLAANNDIFWEPSAIIAGLNILGRKFKPDIILAYGSGTYSTMKSPEICNALYKRLASATLYQQVGPEYWCDYTGAILEMFTGGTNDSFDDKSWAAIVEGWGYYMANTLTEEKYKGFLIQEGDEVARLERKNIENFRVDNDIIDGLATDADGYRGWLACGFLYDLTDVGEQIGITGIKDNVSQYKALNIFKAYTRSVRDINGLKNELITRNAGLQQVQVEELFTSYGY